jgi:hypothetical protein
LHGIFGVRSGAGTPHHRRGHEQAIYQYLYDAAGNRTESKRVATDTIFHPEHNHYHFTNFGSSVLLERNAGSTRYHTTSMKGAKISFCIEDVADLGDSDPNCTKCGSDLQGLTPGWGDKYQSPLFGQRVVIGNEPLADRKYGLKSTVDPSIYSMRARIKERTTTAHDLLHGQGWPDPDPERAQVAVMAPHALSGKR